jgi:mitochondrial enoyl-[acyl-carrier protein] reductase / trans-2-enoyl-CoA reductase
MTNERSYYEILTIRKDATAGEIREAFKKLVIRKHPDHGGSEEEFMAIQKAYEVVSDARRRRIYDHYGARGLEQPAEGLFMQDFRGGSFAAGPEDLEKRMSELRKENESLQQALMLVRPEAASKYASSFEAWLRDRAPGESKVLTAKDIQAMYGVAEGSYEPVRLPALQTLTVEYVKDGALGDAATGAKRDVPEALRWGQVLVHMLSAPVTMLDRHIARWSFVPGEEPQSIELPSVAGAEGVGVVVAVGPGVDSLAVHDLVLPRRPNIGTWRRLGVFEASHLFRFPPTNAAPDAIANFYAYSSAYCMLRDFGALKPGDTIIQSSAETVIGQTIITLCKLLQMKTINLVNPRDDFDEVADALQARGATHVWKNEGSIAERIKRSRISMPRLGIDDQGGSTLTRIAECLRPESTLVLHGATTNKLDSFPYASLLYRALEIRGFSLFRHLAAHEEDFANLPHLLLPLLEQSSIDIDVSAWERLDESLGAALSDKKPNVLLKFGTMSEATALAEQLASGVAKLGTGDGVAPGAPTPKHAPPQDVN